MRFFLRQNDKNQNYWAFETAFFCFYLFKPALTDMIENSNFNFQLSPKNRIFAYLKK
jgi:hypothetical protein